VRQSYASDRIRAKLATDARSSSNTSRTPVPEHVSGPRSTLLRLRTPFDPPVNPDPISTLALPDPASVDSDRCPAQFECHASPRTVVASRSHRAVRATAGSGASGSTQPVAGGSLSWRARRQRSTIRKSGPEARIGLPVLHHRRQLEPICERHPPGFEVGRGRRSAVPGRGVVEARSHGVTESWGREIVGRWGAESWGRGVAGQDRRKVVGAWTRIRDAVVQGGRRSREPRGGWARTRGPVRVACPPGGGSGVVTKSASSGVEIVASTERALRGRGFFRSRLPTRRHLGRERGDADRQVPSVGVNAALEHVSRRRWAFARDRGRRGRKLLAAIRNPGDWRDSAVFVVDSRCTRSVTGVHVGLDRGG
jgi:hypothetical protein